MDLSFSIKSNSPIKVPIINSIISLNLFDWNKDVTVQQQVLKKEVNAEYEVETVYCSSLDIESF